MESNNNYIKYLKYKNKYLGLKTQIGNGFFSKKFSEENKRELGDSSIAQKLIEDKKYTDEMHNRLKAILIKGIKIINSQDQTFISKGLPIEYPYPFSGRSDILSTHLYNLFKLNNESNKQLYYIYKIIKDNDDIKSNQTYLKNLETIDITKGYDDNLKNPFTKINFAQLIADIK